MMSGRERSGRERRGREEVRRERRGRERGWVDGSVVERVEGEEGGR